MVQPLQMRKENRWPKTSKQIKKEIWRNSRKIISKDMMKLIGSKLRHLNKNWLMIRQKNGRRKLTLSLMEMMSSIVSNIQITQQNSSLISQQIVNCAITLQTLEVVNFMLAELVQILNAMLSQNIPNLLIFSIPILQPSSHNWNQTLKARRFLIPCSSMFRGREHQHQI